MKAGKSNTTEEVGWETSKITTAIQQLWTSLQQYHCDLPSVEVILILSDEVWGLAYREQNLLAISDAALKDGPKTVFTVVLHEAAHFLAYAKGINDQHGDSFHNQQFATVAAFYFGLTVRWLDPEYGWAATKAKRKMYKLLKPEYRNLRKAIRR